MWESLVRPPLGRLSVRKFIMLLATLLVVSFGYIFVASPTALAAGEATWKDDAIIYNSHTYKGPVVTKDNDPTKLTAKTTYYSYTPSDASQKSFIIYFSPGVDPPSATGATLATATIQNGEIVGTSAPSDITITPKASAATSNPGTTSCAVEGIGYVVCPVSNFIAKGMDLIYEYIQGFLVVRPLATSQDQAMYRAWAAMRDIANVAFVIGFLVIVYGQLSGGLLSNYTIKKLLPRVIVAAILVNISYWICTVAVDVFNIVGYGIQDLFISIRNSLVGTEGNSWDVISWSSMTSLILSGGSAAAGIGIGSYLGITAATAAVFGTVGVGGAIGGLVILLVPMLIGLMFVVLITFLILAARQAIITVLIILAPLAFVAYLLPNTEKWFEKWRDTLMTLLIVFPAFSVVFGGSQLAAAAIIQNATDINMILLAMAVQVAPLAITPLLLRLGGGVLNRFAGIINNPTKGVFDRGKNWATDRSDATKAKGLANLAERAKTRGYKGARPDGSTRTTRRGRLAENAGNRLNPANAAYAREYNRRRREGEKAGSESLSAGLFTQTDAGKGIYGINRDAEAAKHTGESSSMRAYNAARTNGTDATNARRRQEHHQSHIDQGIGNVYEEGLTTHAERDLQSQINSSANLRNIKIQSTVNSGVADNIKKELDALGASALAETVLASPTLRQQVVRTHEFQGRAAQANELIEDDAKYNWEQLSLNDRTIYSRQLERQGNAKQLKAAQAEWESILVEASAGRTDDYQKKFGPITKTVSDNINRIQEADLNTQVEEKRKASADYVTKVNVTKALKSNNIMLDRAAGIDDQGRVKVIADLAKQGSTLHMQNVEAVESLMSNEGYTMEEEKRILQGKSVRGNTKAPTATERHAAMRRILLTNGNNWAAQEVYDYVVSQGIDYDASTNTYSDENGVSLTEEEASGRRDLQQIWIDASGKSGLKVDYLSGTQRGEAEAGMLRRPDPSRTASEQAITDDINKAKIKGERIANADIDIISRQIQVFSDQRNITRLNPEARTKYVETLNRTLSDQLLGGRMSEREWAHSKILANILDESDTRPMSVKQTTYVNRDGETVTIPPVQNNYNYIR